MEKIIFLVLAGCALAFVIYLGGNAIMTGFKAKSDLKKDELEEDFTNEDDNVSQTDHLSKELEKLNELYKSGALNQEEFEKAKKKILDN